MIERSFFSTYALELTFTFLFFAIVNLVVIYFLRSSELVGKKKRIWISLGTFDFIMIASVIISFVLLRPQKITQRIAFLPTLVNGQVERNLSFLITEQIEHNFANQSQDNIVPHSVWWTYKALNKEYRFSLEKYNELYNKINATYVVNLALSADKSKLSVNAGTFQKDYSFGSVERFSSTSQDIVNDLLTFVGEKRNRPMRNYANADYIHAKHWLFEDKIDSLILMAQTYPVSDSTILANTVIAEAFIHKGYSVSQYLDTENPYIDDTYKKPFIEAQKRLFYFFNKDQQNFDLYPALIKYFLYQENYADADDFIKAGLTDFGNRTTIRKINSDALIQYSYLHGSRLRADGFLNHFDVVKAAIEANPLSLSAYRRLVTLRLKHSPLISEQVDKLFVQLRDFITLNPYNDDAKLLLGDTYLKRGDIVQAWRLFSELYSSYPDKSFMNYNIAITYFRMGRDYASYKEFLAGTDITSGDVATGRAIEHFNKAIAIDKHLDSHLYLGVIYAAREDYDNAIKNFQYRVRHNLGPKDKSYLEAKKGLRKIFEDEDLLRKYLKKADMLKEGY